FASSPCKLSGWRQRKLGDDVEAARNHVAREPFATVRCQLLRRGSSFTRGQHDLRDRQLAEVRMLARRHAAALDRRMRVEHGLDFLAEELHAGHVDARRTASGKSQVPVLVEPALVSRTETVELENFRR